MFTSTNKWVCVSCRVVAKRRAYSGDSKRPRCQGCGGPMKNMGTRFATPKKSDSAGWAKVKRMIRARAIWCLPRDMKERMSREGMFKKEGA